MGDTGSGGPKHPFGSNRAAKPDSKNTYFCKKFLTGDCSQSLKNNGHSGQLGSCTVFMVHICATCWLKDKKRENHPEKSDSCPHHKEWRERQDYPLPELFQQGKSLDEIELSYKLGVASAEPDPHCFLTWVHYRWRFSFRTLHLLGAKDFRSSPSSRT